MNNIFRAALLFVAAIITMTSCVDDVFKKKSYKEVQANYQLYWDASYNSNAGAYFTKVFFASGEGYTSELEDGNEVYFNDEKLYFQAYGYYYSNNKYMASAGATPEFTFVSSDNKTFTNPVEVKAIFANAGGESVNMNQNWTFTWRGIEEDEELEENDKIIAYLLEKDGAIAASVTSSYNTEGEQTNNITFSRSQLNQLAVGEYNLVLERYNIDECPESFGIGSSYTTGVWRTQNIGVTLFAGDEWTSVDHVKATYRLLYDESQPSEADEVLPIVYFYDENGFSTKVSGENDIYFNDEELKFYSYGYYYTANEYLTRNGWTGEFVFESTDNATYTNTVELKEIATTEESYTVNRAQDWTFEWEGATADDKLNEHDYIVAYIKNSNKTVFGIVRSEYNEDGTQTNSITFTAEQLGKIAAGNYSLILERFNVDECTESFGVGTSFTSGLYRTSGTPITLQ